MTFTRVTNPDISIYLLPWYVEAEKSRFEIGEELNERMTQNPDDTCVLVASKDGYMKGVIIGYIEDGDLFVWQASKSKDMDKPRLIFKIMCDWARDKGAKKVTIGSPDKRVRRLYKRKYGFTPAEGMYMEKTL
jgi:hypothetical protein